jgi:AraC family transcriptional regulator
MVPKSLPGLLAQRRRQDLGEFILTDSVYKPELRMPKHAHELAYFCVVLGGSYTESYAAVSRTYSAGTVVFHPQGETHSDQFHQSGGHIFNVTLSSKWLNRVEECSRVLPRTDHLQGGRAAWIARRIYGEFLRPDDHSLLAVEGLVLEILVEASRHARGSCESAPPRWLKQVLEVLHARFTEHLTLEELARDVGVHPLHLARVFRRHCRSSVGEYVRKLRLDFVCRRLAASEAPIVEIALAAGFSDQSHFSKFFRAQIGMTPSRFRSVSGRR